MGNMVVLSAISDYSAAPSHYFMIDAAVPMEAVQGNIANEPAMIYSTWAQYDPRLYASDWWQLFANTDARSTLTWSNRLGNLGSVDIYNFYFRVRTKLDESGNVVSARYGKIYGDLAQFTYYFNPTPNDRNVEFDLKQNLMTNLKPNEGVSQP